MRSTRIKNVLNRMRENVYFEEMPLRKGLCRPLTSANN